MIGKYLAVATMLLWAPAAAHAADWTPVGTFEDDFVFRKPAEITYADGSREIEIVRYHYVRYLEDDGSTTVEFGTGGARFRVDCDWLVSEYYSSREIGEDGLGVPPVDALAAARLTPRGNLMDDFAMTLTGQVCDADPIPWTQRFKNAESMEAFAKAHLATPPAKFAPLPKSTLASLTAAPPPVLVPRPPLAGPPPKKISSFPYYPDASWTLVSRHQGGGRSMYLDAGHVSRNGSEASAHVFMVFPDDFDRAPAALLSLQFNCAKQTVSITWGLDWHDQTFPAESTEWYLHNQSIRAGGAMEAALKAACDSPPAGRRFDFLHEAYDDALSARPAPGR